MFVRSIHLRSAQLSSLVLADVNGDGAPLPFPTTVVTDSISVPVSYDDSCSVGSVFQIGG